MARRCWDEAQTIRANLDEMAADRALGLVTRSHRCSKPPSGGMHRLAEIENGRSPVEGEEDLFGPILLRGGYPGGLGLALTTGPKAGAGG